MRTRILALLTVCALLAACGGDTGLDLDEDTTQALDDLETQLDEVQNQIDASEFQQELETAWNTIEDDVNDAIDSLRAGEAVDTEQIEEQLDQFQQELESVEVEDELREAWDQLRSDLEQLMNEMG